jgi:integrase
MPRPAKPARLLLREGEGRTPTWVILDLVAGRRKEIATGCGAFERAGAEAKLADYIAARSKPNRDSGRDPSAIAIAEILNLYALDHGKTLARPGELARRVETLLGFFGDRPVAALNRRLCRDYAASRGDHQQAARRELQDLSAALGHARREEIITIAPVIELPAKAPPRERWLTRSEAAKLIWSCWRFRQKKPNGEPGNLSRQHLARFILVALYTGTRSAAICGAAMGPAIGRGYVDLDQGVFYRRAQGKAETNKRQPPVRLPPRLLAHLKRWKRRGISLRAVVEYDGRPVVSVKMAFANAAAAVGLDDVSPHTLRHSAITWAMQDGATPYDASDYFGVSERVIHEVYGHHSPDRHVEVGNAITRYGPKWR